MSFDPTKPQPWDIYSYKVRPGFTASSAPVEGDQLRASGLGIKWSPSDTALCEAQAEQGRAYATSATVIEKPSCDCKDGCAKCDDRSESFYRPQHMQTGQLLRNAAGTLADYDALVLREMMGSGPGRDSGYIIVPQSIRAREWFSIHYAERQNAAGQFLFLSDSEVIELAQRAKEVGITFGKGY